MSSIALAIFKHTIDLLVNKGRDKAAEKLKDGDVTDQKFRDLIVREIDDIKSKLDGLSRKDLLASISFFKEGIELLYEVFDKASSRSSFGAVTASAARAEKVCLAEEVKNLELNDLDESETRKLSKAKKLFEDARRKATEAFNNEALGTSDRILAMQYRVMATILETVDNPADALAQGRVCINELHSMAAVKNSFNTQLKKGIQTFRGLFSKEERRQIISDVCHVNRVIYDITLTLGEGLSVSVHPVVDTGKEKVELLSDERVGKVLRKQGMEHCIVAPSSFGLAAEQGHKLIFPSGIVTNSRGEFVVADYSSLMVFDRGGKFVKRFSLRNFADFYSFHSVAVDISDNVFVLTEWHGEYLSYKCSLVCKLTKTSDLSQEFFLGEKDGYRGLSVSDTGKILTLREARAVEEYDTGGKFYRSFGEGILKEAFDITIANDGRVMVAGVDGINTFSDHGDHLNHFQLQTPHRISSVGLTYHRAGEHVVVASTMGELLDVAIYTNNGEFVRSAQIQNEHFYSLGGIALTTDGRIAIALIHYLHTPINVSKVPILRKPNVSKVLVLRKPYLTP